MTKFSYIETYYNTHMLKTVNLPFAILTKSSARGWRSNYRRFNAHPQNYSYYLNGHNEQFSNQISNISQVKGMLHIHQKFKTFDKLILYGPTSHTVLLPYFLLDQGWATAGTRAELGTRARKFGTQANLRKRDPFLQRKQLESRCVI